MCVPPSPLFFSLLSFVECQVHNYVNLTCTHPIQTLPLAQGVGIVDCATLSEEVTPHDFNLVLVATPTAVLQVKPKPFSVQVDNLLAEEKVEEAFTLVQKTAHGDGQEAMLESFNIKVTLQ